MTDYKITIHPLAEKDLKALHQAGLSHFADRAAQQLKQHSELPDFPHERGGKVTLLAADAPGWFRLKHGRIRIIFRFVKSDPSIPRADTIEVVRVDQRDESTYGRELRRRYALIEGQ